MLAKARAMIQPRRSGMIDTEAITDTCYELARKDYSHQLG